MSADFMYYCSYLFFSTERSPFTFHVDIFNFLGVSPEPYYHIWVVGACFGDDA